MGKKGFFGRIILENGKIRVTLQKTKGRLAE
jgi:hypothetical protein